MVELQIDELLNVAERAIREKLADAGESVCIRFVEHNYYAAFTEWDFAGACLVVWYIAERLAEGVDFTSIRLDDAGIDGDAVAATVQLTGFDIDHVAAVLADLAPSFDPEGGEAVAFIFDEADDWLSKYAKPFRFPNLQKEYQQRKAAAAENEPEDTGNDT